MFPVRYNGDAISVTVVFGGGEDWIGGVGSGCSLESEVV